MEPDEIAEAAVKFDLLGAESVIVRRDVVWRTTAAATVTLDLYLPPGFVAGTTIPAVVIVAGYPDPGFRKFCGLKFKDTGSSLSWGRLLAASGLAVVVYENTDPEADLRELLQFLRNDGPAYGVDPARIGLWASSGNVPLALAALMEDGGKTLKCAALCYGYTLDLDGATDVADAAAMFKFANPNAGKTVADLPSTAPLLIVRAGIDAMPGLNDALDRFLLAALKRNLPVSLVNQAVGQHAFDILQDGPAARDAIRLILAFLRIQLLRLPEI